MCPFQAKVGVRFKVSLPEPEGASEATPIPDHAPSLATPLVLATPPLPVLQPGLHLERPLWRRQCEILIWVWAVKWR